MGRLPAGLGCCAGSLGLRDLLGSWGVRYVVTATAAGALGARYVVCVLCCGCPVSGALLTVTGEGTLRMEPTGDTIQNETGTEKGKKPKREEGGNRKYCTS